jgi:hypothetical protein
MYPDLKLLTIDAAAGDRTAWEELVDVYAGAVWDLARAGAEREQAADACELAWLRAAQAVHACPRIGRGVWDILQAAVLREVSGGDLPPAVSDRHAAQRITLALPAHRIAPGAVVAVTSPDGLHRRFRLPEDAAPGAVVVLSGEDGGMEIVIGLRAGLPPLPVQAVTEPVAADPRPKSSAL